VKGEALLASSEEKEEEIEWMEEDLKRLAVN